MSTVVYLLRKKVTLTIFIGHLSCTPFVCVTCKVRESACNLNLEKLLLVRKPINQHFISGEVSLILHICPLHSLLPWLW